MTDYLKPCPFCGGDATLTANWNKTYRKWYVNCRCTVCGSSGKGYTCSVDPEKDDWENSACHNAATLWNSRPYSNDEIMSLATEVGEYILSKSHTDDVLLPDQAIKDGAGNG